MFTAFLYGGKNMNEEKKCIVDEFKKKTNEMFNPIDGYSASEIEEMVICYVKEVFAWLDIEAEIVDLALYGSRCRGMECEDSDIDVVVEIHSENEREDNLFNILNEDRLTIAGIEVDINPILPQATGTLSEYLPVAEKYMETLYFREKALLL